MTGEKQRIPFFTDNDVDDDVGELLKESGHDVVRLREIMITDSADQVVAAACRQQGMVLLTHNIRHFRAIVKGYEITKRQADSLCRIELGCKQFAALKRVQEELPVIELEWGRLGQKKSGLWIYIGDTVIRVHR